MSELSGPLDGTNVKQVETATNAMHPNALANERLRACIPIEPPAPSIVARENQPAPFAHQEARFRMHGAYWHQAVGGLRITSTISAAISSTV